MNDIANALYQWILAQQIDGCSIEATREDCITITCSEASGWVSFYDIDNMMVVELRLERARDGENVFFLHFELEDLGRAQELFSEMAAAIEKMLKHNTRHVLLCCSCGITTTFFADKLNRTAQDMGLDYDFCAMPINEAKENGANFAAVLLAPQVGHMRKQVVEALPDTLVLELPGRIFGTYDAAAALMLVVDALTGARKDAISDLRMARDFDHSRRVLAVCYVHREDDPTLSYRVLDHGKEVEAGTLIRSYFDIHVVDDLAATLRVAGFPPETFDAVGIALPGRVDKGVVLESYRGATQRADLARIMREKWHVPVYIDNAAVAAATGCYVSQTEWDDVTFHAQPVGVVACDEGHVVQGRPLTGKAGFSGSLSYVADDFKLSMSLDDAAWRYDGICELVGNYLTSVICTLAPQAIYVWCDLIPDMDDLREKIEKRIPADAIPELVDVSSYEEYALVGELALCLRRIAKNADQ